LLLPVRSRHAYFCLDLVYKHTNIIHAQGYPVIITLPEKMSLEKEVTLRALGAEVVRTPTEAPSNSEESNIGVAKRLQKLIPGGVILCQYDNENNPLAHEFGTGEEIIAQVTQDGTTGERKSTGKVDVLFAGVGTGGTISGCSRALKKHNPEVVVVGIDPVSIHSFTLSSYRLRCYSSVKRTVAVRAVRMSLVGLNLFAPPCFEFR